jgi:hypothetical protein
MRERPMLMSAPMVRAILAGRKTQTRRVVKDAPDGAVRAEMLPQVGPDERVHFPYRVGFFSADGLRGLGTVRCPYGQPGDGLWVKETWANATDAVGTKFSDPVLYRADFVGDDGSAWWRRGALFGGNWRPSIFMPRWASRLTLEVTSIRVERVQDISEEDARAEGCDPGSAPVSARWHFEALWSEINGADAWNENPFCWVIAFRRVWP